MAPVSLTIEGRLTSKPAPFRRKSGSLARWTIPAATLAALIAAMFVPTAATADEPRPDPFFGVISQRVMHDPDFDKMVDGHLGSYRLPVDWGTVEKKGDGVMDWRETDRVVAATARRGIDVLLNPYGSPLRLNRTWRIMPIVNAFQIRKYRQFLTEMVARYGSDGTFWVKHPDLPYRPVTRWQIWNEPNINAWANPVSPPKYARLLRISSRTIKAVDADSKIVLAGLYGKPPPGSGINPGPFMDRLYKSFEFKQSFDIGAVHPYSASGREALQRTNPVRRSMNRHGNRNKPLVITELGWGSDDKTGFGKGSERAQANELRSAYRIFIANRARLKLRAIYWFSWEDVPEGLKTCDFCAKTGFFTAHGEPKQSWFELLKFSRRN